MRHALLVVLAGCVVPAKQAPEDDVVAPDAGEVGIDAQACTPIAPGGGARGLFHFDEPSGQTATNAVGGHDAVLGYDDALDANDPERMSPARFDGGLHFTTADADLVSWPADLGDVGDHMIEVWVRPSATGGTLLASGDGTISLTLAPEPLRAVYTLRKRDSVETATVTSHQLTYDTWHHVLASYKKPHLRLWVDGIAAPTADLDAGYRGEDFVLGLGLAGDLDELYFAEATITEDSVAQARYCPP